MVNLFSVLINFIVMREYFNDRQPGLAEQISHWLDDHLTEPVTLEDAAAAVYRSCSTVSHAIKQQFGMSFKRLFNLKRIQRFERLLADEPGLNISGAAFKAGYQDPLYFSRVYKKIRHIPPVAYQRMIKDSEQALRDAWVT
jgi:AraC-like DNA-binding protein